MQDLDSISELCQQYEEEVQKIWKQANRKAQRIVKRFHKVGELLELHGYTQEIDVLWANTQATLHKIWLDYGKKKKELEQQYLAQIH